MFLDFLFEKKIELEKPIFLLGCARSGTTVLSAPFYFHPDVGPKPFDTKGMSLQPFIDTLLKYDKHAEFSEVLEKQKLWFEFFNQKRITTDLGKELIVEKCPRSKRAMNNFLNKLCEGFSQKRFFSKSPSGSFRMKAIKEMFPDVKFVVIHRNGCDVVNSWGNRPYGFAKMGYENGIEFFSNKWNETEDYLLKASNEIDVIQIKYEDYVANPQSILIKLFEYCELEVNKIDLAEIKLHKRNNQWKQAIPKEFHESLLEHTSANNIRLGYRTE